MANAVDTLLMALPDNAEAGKVLFLNATLPELPASRLPDQWLCEQPHRERYLALQRAGHDVVPAFDDHTAADADWCLVIAGRNRRENEIMIARASAAAKPDGSIAVAGAKTDGIAPLRKFAAKHTEVELSLSKHHAQAFVCRPSQPLSAAAALRPDQPPIEGFETAPGMFSSSKIDTGSAMLAAHFDEKITGAVADFGAGWGYLSRALLTRGRPSLLALYESHWPSLKAAELNIANHAVDCAIEAHWHDLLQEPVQRRFDWIVMNPPFHAGRRAEATIGERFVQRAAGALKPGGRLIMVANQTLGYERTLEASFGTFSEIERAAGYKIILARR